MPLKLKNRSLRREDFARAAAKAALWDWYETGYKRAMKKLPTMQIDSNLKKVASIPGWQEKKGIKHGYVMLASWFTGTLRPIILTLDYETKASGGLTHRQLYLQVREALGLELKASLRLCPSKPWYQHMRRSYPVPEHRALPASDSQCTHLRGTTLMYFPTCTLSDLSPCG